MVPIIPIDLNVTMNTSVCTMCATVYNEINDFFLRITQGRNMDICMDIVDTVRIKIFFSIILYLMFSR
jgi:hypothetical protein